MDLHSLLHLPHWLAMDIDADGRILAGTNATGSVQLVEIDADGTHTPLTALPGACRGRYVPGERAVIVSHDNGGDEQGQISLLRLDSLPPSPVGLDDLTPVVHDPAFKNDVTEVLPGQVLYSTNRSNGVDFEVYARSLADGTDTPVYTAGGYVAGVKTRQVDGRLASCVTLLSLEPNSTQLFLSDQGTVTALTSADERALQWAGFVMSPDTLLVSSNRGRDLSAVFRVHLHRDADGTLGTPEQHRWEVLVEDPEHDVWAEPSPDGTLLLVVTSVHGAARAAFHDAATGAKLRDVAVPAFTDLMDFTWSADGSYLVCMESSMPRPLQVVRITVATGAYEVVADAVTSGDTALPTADGGSISTADALAGMVEATDWWVPTRDGERIPCFVFTPSPDAPGLQPDADGVPRRSVVLHIHGGPEAQATRRFSNVMQALVADGHIVVVPNVRGSTGYGKRWYSLDDVELRMESIHDLADIRAHLPDIGGDPERAALIGGSYGGYMTLAGLTMQPDLWAAGVAIVGMSSLVTFLENTSPYRRAVREREYGSLEHHRELLEELSPLTYLDQLRAPLFLIHGANDPRVPLSESEQIRDALVARNVPCVLKAYYDEGHGLAKRVNQVDAYPAAVDFLREHLQAPRAV